MCYHPFWLGQYYDKNARVLRAPLIQLKYTLKHWKSAFCYWYHGVTEVAKTADIAKMAEKVHKLHKRSSHSAPYKPH